MVDMVTTVSIYTLNVFMIDAVGGRCNHTILCHLAVFDNLTGELLQKIPCYCVCMYVCMWLYVFAWNAATAVCATSTVG